MATDIHVVATEPADDPMSSLLRDGDLNRPERVKRLRNWADSEKVRDRIKKEIIPLMDLVRRRRSTLEDEWGSLFRVWDLIHEEQGYLGRSNIYVPAGRKVIDTLVARLVNATFPGDDNFGVEARRPENADHALICKDTLKYRVENTARVRLYAEEYYRQLLITGNSPAKVFYDRKVIKHKRRRALMRPTTAPEPITVLRDGPFFNPLEVQNLYVYPENVKNIEDASIVFEDLQVSITQLRDRARSGKYLKSEVEECAKGLQNSDKYNKYDDKLVNQGIEDINNVHDDSFGNVDLTEVWLEFDPDAESAAEEKYPIPFLITIAAGNKILRAIPNPLMHQLPPYLWGKIGTVTGRFYGSGVMVSIRQLNLLLNDQTNQGMDCANYVLNPIVIHNPNSTMGVLPDLEPGVVIPVIDMAGFRFDRPPPDLVQIASVLTTQTSSWIQDYGGAPPVLSGGSSPGRAFRTATGVGAAQSNASVPIQEIVRLSETQVWERMLYHFYMLDQQFADKELIYKVAGKYKSVNPTDIEGDWMYRWLASSQTASQTQRVQQIMQFMGIISQQGVAQLIQAQGRSINPIPLLKRLYEEGFGFRDVEAVFPQAGPPGSPQGVGQPMPGGPPSSLPEPGSESYSQEPQAGNGAFDAVRAEADSISANQGTSVDTFGFE